MTLIAQKTIESNGKTINITKVHKERGMYEGDVCDLCEYVENGVKYLIERPLLAN